MSGSTAPWFLEQFRAPNGAILSGGRLYFFVAGSTVLPKNVYADYAMTQELPQPLVLDASGFAPEYFMEDGLYKIVVRDSSSVVADGMVGGLVVTRDNVQGSTTGGGETDDHLVIADPSDPTPGSLAEKTRSSASVSITVVDVGGRKLQFDVDEDWLTSWLTINYPFPADDHLVVSDGTTQAAGTLAQKVTDALGATFAVNGAKQLIIPLQGRLSLVDGGRVTGPTIFDNITFPDQFKIKAGSGDIAGYYVDKIQPGTGIEFNQTVDGVHGAVLHISTTEDGAVTAPLHEVMTGDGAGGVLSDPAFTAVGGDVQADTLQANAAGDAITTPNGAMTAREVAQMDQAGWGGSDFAWFGRVGHNPVTDDGTIAGLMVGDYSTILRAPTGGSVSLGVGMGNEFAVYEDQAGFDVPTFAPAFHQLDVAILTGAAYSTTYHAVVCFAGTGTAFAVPDGASLNRSVRLSNSTAAGIAMTGEIFNPFTLAPNTSRDLSWDLVSGKWY